jgi:hypothetical protein
MAPMAFPDQAPGLYVKRGEQRGSPMLFAVMRMAVGSPGRLGNRGCELSRTGPESATFHPHTAPLQDNRSSSAIDGRTTRHPSCRINQAKRYWVEKPFGWMKSVGPLSNIKVRGPDKL